jgi:hypothetical protein
MFKERMSGMVRTMFMGLLSEGGGLPLLRRRLRVAAYDCPD